MSRTLPAADWTRREDLAALTETLLGDAEPPRYVGGAVRDTLLGHPVKDIDIATPLLPEAVIERLERAGIKTIPTGIEHGTVTALLDRGPVEITTLRRDVSTDGRRATVAFSTDWREDAARRDFTINALFAEPDGWSIHDYFDGLADLDARRVRFIGDANQRIAEDHLRILRYFRFLARFGAGEPDAEALAACAAGAASLKALSRERIASELLALLALPDPLGSADLMQQTGIWPHILPERQGADPDAPARLIERERTFGVAPHMLARFAALLPPDPDIADRAAARLRLSNAQRKLAAMLAQQPPAHRSARAIAVEQGSEAARLRLLLHAGDERLAREWPLVAEWEPPAFPLSGRHILALGVEPGPKVAGALNAIRERWIAEDFPEGSALDGIAREVVADLG